MPGVYAGFGAAKRIWAVEGEFGAEDLCGARQDLEA